MNRGEVRHAIRRDVLARITHLVNQLLFYTRNDDPAAGPLVLCNDKRSIRRGFDDRKSDVGEIRNAAPLILAVATRRLRAAFNDVTGDRSRREPVPIVVGPAKLVYQRRKRQARICGSTRDHDLRALVQGVNNRPRAQVSIGALNLVADCRERLACLHVAQLDTAREEIVEPRHDVVAGDDADADFACETKLTRNLNDCFRASANINAARIRSDFNIALDTRGQNPAHERHEILCVTRIRIACFLFLHDRHRHFREIVEHDVIDWSTFNLANGCVKKVSPKALSGCDAYFLFHVEAGNGATKRHKKLAQVFNLHSSSSVFCAFVATLPPRTRTGTRDRAPTRTRARRWLSWRWSRHWASTWARACVRARVRACLRTRTRTWTRAWPRRLTRICYFRASRRCCAAVRRTARR